MLVVPTATIRCPRALRLVEPGRRGRGQFEIFRQHLMLRIIVVAHRQEGARPHVQGDGYRLDTPPPQVLENLSGKMQARGGAGHGSGLPGEPGLVAVPIRLGGRAVDVGRQRHLAVGQHPAQGVPGGRGKPHLRHPGFGQGDDFGLQVGAEMKHLAGPQAAPMRGPGPHRPGAIAFRLRQVVQEQFHPAAALFHALEAGGKDPGIVDHQQIIRV